MMKLHAVRQLRERIVAGERADAPLGALAIGDVARDEDAALELRIIACDLRAGEGNGYRLPVARAHDGLARLLCRLAQIERLALALIKHRADGAANEFLFAETDQPPG